jgi:hypothetical protein
MAFWRNIKEGYDHFEVTHLEPKVDVCDKKYVFDAHPVTADSTTFNNTGACPVYKVPDEIAEAVSAKQKADDADYKVQVAELETQERAEATQFAIKEVVKPKQAPTSLLASIVPVSNAPVATVATPAATAPISVASATPINVPVPKPSPLAMAQSDVASGYSATEKPRDGDVIGNFLNIVKLPEFGQSSSPAPQPQVQQASVSQQSTASQPTAPDVAKIKGTTTATTKPAPAKATVATASAPTPAPAAAPSSTAVETPWWKKLNPFGG